MDVCTFYLLLWLLFFDLWCFLYPLLSPSSLVTFWMGVFGREAQQDRQRVRVEAIVPSFCMCVKPYTSLLKVLSFGCFSSVSPKMCSPPLFIPSHIQYHWSEDFLQRAVFCAYWLHISHSERNMVKSWGQLFIDCKRRRIGSHQRTTVQRTSSKMETIRVRYKAFHVRSGLLFFFMSEQIWFLSFIAFWSL